jgi:EAL domain-containing protein (putative c-di-GMP-specific phosphodiesterase class I)
MAAKAGVEIVQGFLFDRAMTPEAFEARYFSMPDNAENG